MYYFFSKIPSDAKWAHEVNIKAWMERRFEKKLLEKSKNKISVSQFSLVIPSL